ncbi:3-phosphoshikimate 1-carboxyvinyltransferase, partial [bacterium]|nr:3-phosphoshikimate 1-carboxyvinyltransferase [bacterium]
MTDPLPIIPLTRPLDSSIALPGSKSITNRALILAALAEGETTLKGALFSRDTRIMIAALKELGFTISFCEQNKTIVVEGGAGRIPIKEAEIHIGNAGTAARFLTAFLALEAGGIYRLDGDPAMRERPMAGLLTALVDLAAAEIEFHGEDGFFPFTLHAKGFSGGAAEVDASASSQILSALLLAAPAGSRDTTLSCPGVRPAYVAITLKMREAFHAVAFTPRKGIYELRETSYMAPDNGLYHIEPDLSAASYFLALTLIQGGELCIPNISADPLQGDVKFASVLATHGLKHPVVNGAWHLKRDTLLTRGDREIDFNLFSDTFLTYAAIAPLLEGTTRITGIGHTRMQETDRIAGMVTELRKLGIEVEEEDSSLTIHPNLEKMKAHVAANRPIEIETYEDHRFAMSFGILGTYDLLGDGQAWLAVKDPQCCGKTFPEFFEVLEGF